MFHHFGHLEDKSICFYLLTYKVLTKYLSCGCLSYMSAKVQAKATARKERMLTKWEKSGRMSQPEPWPLNLFRFCIETRPSLEKVQKNQILCGARNHIEVKHREKGTVDRKIFLQFLCVFSRHVNFRVQDSSHSGIHNKLQAYGEIIKGWSDQNTSFWDILPFRKS